MSPSILTIELISGFLNGAAGGVWLSRDSSSPVTVEKTACKGGEGNSPEVVREDNHPPSFGPHWEGTRVGMEQQQQHMM